MTVSTFMARVKVLYLIMVPLYILWCVFISVCRYLYAYKFKICNNNPTRKCNIEPYVRLC